MAVKVRERDGAWWLFIDHKGKRKAKRVGEGKQGKKAAFAAAEQIQAKLVQGDRSLFEAPAPFAPAPSFAEYAERWLASAAATRLRPSTVDEYRARLRLRLLPTLGPLRLTGIGRDTVRTLLAEMVRTGTGRRAGQPIARATVRETLGLLSAILATAEDDGLIPKNPARRMGKQIAATGAAEVREIEVFDRSEVSCLLSLAERDWPEYHPFLLCLARTGLRLGEAMALQWRDVDWTNRVLLVRRARRRNRISEPKNGKARRVDMSQQLADVLRGLRSLQEAESVLAGQVPPDRVFSNRSGGPIQEDAFRNNVWTPMLRRAGLRYRKPHTLRHTYASILIEAKEDLKYIQEQMGHHSPEFTFKVYGHLLPRRGDRRGVDILDDATIRNPVATELDVASSEFNRFG